jgi:hypothetical protein
MSILQCESEQSSNDEACGIDNERRQNEMNEEQQE